MFTASFLANLAEEFYNKLNTNNFKTPKKRLEEFTIPFDYSPKQKEIIGYLNDDKILKKIIIANPNYIKVIIRLFKIKKWDKELKNNNFGEQIEALFSYENFRESKKASWLAKKLDIKTCLYCNSQYAFVVGDNITYTFDHFYPKSIYPYLSLSFYNLIPACDYCNRRKSAKEKELPYPYQENHHKDYKISVDAESLIAFHNTSMKDETKLKIEVNAFSSEEIKNLNDIINISKLYESHTDMVAELIWKAEVYTKEYQKELEDILGVKDLHTEINRFITGNYTDEKDFHKRPLSKLTHDIAQELGLIP